MSIWIFEILARDPTSRRLMRGRAAQSFFRVEKSTRKLFANGEYRGDLYTISTRRMIFGVFDGLVRSRRFSVPREARRINAITTMFRKPVAADPSPSNDESE